MAIAKANELNIPFIANGDTTDTKAILRAECVNAMIETFKTAKIKPYVNIGNHCKINSKSKEHAMNFLAPYAHIIDEPQYVAELNSYIIPYNDDVEDLRKYLKTLSENSRLILHQGLQESDMGDYMHDHSALSPSDLANFRSILSHYHSRQDIKCGRPGRGAVGLASYLGSPYSVTFGEARDLPKGYSVLMDDGSLEFIPTNLRKHVVIEARFEQDGTITASSNVLEQTTQSIDLVKLKLTGTKEQLSRVDRKRLGIDLMIPESYKLELIPLDTKSEKHIKNDRPQTDSLDMIIESAENTSIEQKERVKALWRSLCG